MATSKTSSFWLTETITFTAAGVSTASIDLGAYVDVGDQQAIGVEQVDFIFQRYDTASEVYDSALGAAFATDGTLSIQVTDLNRGGSIVRADDRSLVGSGALMYDTANIASRDTDMFPDNYGPAAAQGTKIVVNDNMYITGDMNGTLNANNNVVVTARIKAKIIKLSKNDWMSIAIQSTAADN